MRANDEQYIINKIDLVNECVRKVYLHFTPLSLGEGSGERLSGCVLKRGGHTDKRVNHKVNFDFD